jgi:hypothetical protein
MLQDRNAPAVVTNTHAPVSEQSDFDPGAIPGHGLIDRVVDSLPDEVVKPPRPGRPDVHRGSSPDRLETLEDLDILRFV